MQSLKDIFNGERDVSHSIGGTTYTANTHNGFKAHKDVKAYQVACGVFAAVAVGLAVAAPFTGAVLFIPALVCAVAALGLGIYVISVKYNKEIKEEVSSLASAASISREQATKEERKRAQDAADTKRTADNTAMREEHAETRASLRAKYNLPKKP